MRTKKQMMVIVKYKITSFRGNNQSQVPRKKTHYSEKGQNDQLLGVITEGVRNPEVRQEGIS